MTLPSFKLGESIPRNTAHAVSVSLPTWKANVAYEEGEAWVVDSMITGYPRFFIHKSIEALVSAVILRHSSGATHDSSSSDDALVGIALPGHASARRCVDFVRARESDVWLETIDLASRPQPTEEQATTTIESVSNGMVSVVCCHKPTFGLLRQFWQHTGEGISSRRAEWCLSLLKHGKLVRVGPATPARTLEASSPSSRCSSALATRTSPPESPKRYPQPPSRNELHPDPKAIAPKAKAVPPLPTPQIIEAEDGTYNSIEQCFGHNLDISLVPRAKSAIKRRIAGALRYSGNVLDDDDNEPLPSSVDITHGVKNPSEDDIYLFSCGMNAIYNTHRALMAARGTDKKSINFGFPYVDTLKILEKFGPGCHFFGHGTHDDLEDLEHKLKKGELTNILALFCEFPGNPLLRCPSLPCIRRLADKYNFCVVVDETIGTFANVNVLPYADVMVSSLTKIFSGDCNVMGGSAVLNPNGAHYTQLKRAMEDVHEDANYWDEDVIVMERNSRDFSDRIARINQNSEVICDVLLARSAYATPPPARPVVKKIYYPKHNLTVTTANVSLVPALRNPLKSLTTPSALNNPTILNDTDAKSNSVADPVPVPRSQLVTVPVTSSVTYTRPDPNYEHCRIKQSGGYGGLLSVTFYHHAQAVAFYDALNIAKGPSLGTNFTLSSPYVVLAHYHELEWAEQYGVERDLVRVSVGLEDEKVLVEVFESALDAAERAVAAEGLKEPNSDEVMEAKRNADGNETGINTAVCTGNLHGDKAAKTEC